MNHSQASIETTPCCGPTCCTDSPKTQKSDAIAPEAVERAVREKYDAAARAASAGRPAIAGFAAGCCGAELDPITSDLYSQEETMGLPGGALLASLGCGNPTALAELRPGERVLDLGSGGGIDVLLSARRVGPSGKAYGLDRSDEMLALARENQAKAGLDNVEFLRGAIEEVPLPSASVDVVISNCVINLSTDKRRALAEAYRVLKPGGRLAVSDVVFLGEVPADLKRSVEIWAGCVAGALQVDDYRDLLAEVGFEGVEIEPTRVYRGDDLRQLVMGTELAMLAERADEVDGKAASAFVRATRPVV